MTEVPVPNDLGILIGDEVKRAESDFGGLRSRGQSVLTASGGLVTLLAAVLALAVGKDEHLVLSGLTGVAAIAALFAFVVASVSVVLMYLPSRLEAPNPEQLAGFVSDEWDSEGWDQQVAAVQTKYLVSLRRANSALANKLTVAVVAEVVGIACVALMALSLVVRA
jgi:hypothetical protein